MLPILLTMTFVIWIIFLCLSSFHPCETINNSDTEKILEEFNSRIISGRKVENRKQFPYQVSLLYIGHHFCGGVIYLLDTVISASHCMVGMPKGLLRVVVGNIRLNQMTEDTKVYRVQDVIRYSTDQDPLENDVALIKIQGSFEWNEFVAPLKLSTKSPDPNTKCVVSGWGRPSTASKHISRDLLYTNVSIINHNDCKKFVEQKKKYSRGMICAVGLNTGACNGDSGGPVVCNNELVGIVSWGIQCNSPDVYANVWHYRTWLEHSPSLTSSYFSFSLLVIPVMQIFL